MLAVDAAGRSPPFLVIDLPSGTKSFANPNNGCFDSDRVSDNGLSNDWCSELSISICKSSILVYIYFVTYLF